MTHAVHCWHSGAELGAMRTHGCCSCLAILVEPSEILREEKTHGGPHVGEACSRAADIAGVLHRPQELTSSAVRVGERALVVFRVPHGVVRINGKDVPCADVGRALCRDMERLPGVVAVAIPQGFGDVEVHEA